MTKIVGSCLSAPRRRLPLRRLARGFISRGRHILNDIRLRILLRHCRDLPCFPDGRPASSSEIHISLTIP